MSCMSCMCHCGSYVDPYPFPHSQRNSWVTPTAPGSGATAMNFKTVLLHKLRNPSCIDFQCLLKLSMCLASYLQMLHGYQSLSHCGHGLNA